MNRFIFFFVQFLFPLVVWAGTVDTLDVRSQAMRKNIKCVVITPDGYATGTKAYPVVYLLHGYSGNYAQWIRETPSLAADADRYQMIIICPDGGFNSWYFDSPVDSSVRYETFITKELAAWADATYRILTGKENRAITGLSMGGHGALYLSFRNPDVFGAAGSMAGGVDIRPFPKNWDMTRVLGDTLCCWENWEKNTVINLADTLKTTFPALIIDCGVEDFFFQVNRNLHQKLMDQQVPHDYIERPGKHNRDYWSNSVAYQLLFFRKFFDRNTSTGG